PGTRRLASAPPSTPTSARSWTVTPTARAGPRTPGTWGLWSSASAPDTTRGIMVARWRARYGAWYELFPRSCAPEPGRHGTFRDVEERLPYVADMGFDVLYLPPIHPIGRSFRKGRNNSTTPGPEDPGSPWAIGAAEGGHK